MTQPIAVGAVLGGRYRITEHVVTSADQDTVFHGTDQVLNRRVTVLLASVENAAQVAASARDLATGERDDDVQVLDLGLSDGRTYLIAGGSPDPDVLLGLAYEQQVHVEPFETDSLGSELFGQERTPEAHAYDDDEAYYTDLDRRLRSDEQQSRRRPGFLNRISERISERVRPADGTAAKAAADASTLAAADAATRAQQEEREREERRRREAEEQARREAEEKARREAEEAERRRVEEERRRAEEEAERRRLEEERRRREAEEQARREAEEKARREAEEAERRRAEEERRRLEAEEAERRRIEAERERAETARAEAEEAELQRRRDAAATAALPLAAGASAAPSAGADGAADPEQPPTRRRRPAPRRALTDPPAAAAGAAATGAHLATATQPTDAALAEDVHGRHSEAPGESRGRRAAWPLFALLGLLLLGAVLLGLLLLGQNTRSITPAPAESSAAAPAEQSASSEPAESESPTAAAPRVVAVTRDVPDMPSLEQENDGTLAQLVDGDPDTVWQSFAYNRPNFGGYVESMNLVAELEETTTVHGVTLRHQGAQGGAWFAYVADSPDGQNAREIGNGTFDEREIDIPVDGEGLEGKYVIVSLTSLPRLEGAGGQLPFGLRLSEISVR